VVTTAATLVVIIAQAAWTVGPMSNDAQNALEAIAQYEPYLEMASEKLGLAEGEGLDKYADSFALSVMVSEGRRPGSRSDALLQLNAEFRASSAEEGERIFAAVVESVNEILTKEVYIRIVVEGMDWARERFAMAEAEYRDVRSEYEDSIADGGERACGEIQMVSDRIASLQSELLELRIEADIAELEADRLSEYAANELKGLQGRMEAASEKLSGIPGLRDEGMISEEEFAALKERYLGIYADLEDRQAELQDTVSRREFELIGLHARMEAYERALEELMGQRQELRGHRLVFERLEESMGEVSGELRRARDRLRSCEERAGETREPRLVQPPRVQVLSEEEWARGAAQGAGMSSGLGMGREAPGGGMATGGVALPGGGSGEAEAPLPPVINLPAGTPAERDSRRGAR